MRVIIIVAGLAILGALASAGLFMLRRDSRKQGAESRMAWALAVRVGLSVSLFLFVLLAYWLGWIEPTGLPLGR
ncbi:MAG TPA: DUF2909 domain-containing protein [Ideonella sp.]|nr:DUF2909 domain-containing protein [Ideonella sp.]